MSKLKQNLATSHSELAKEWHPTKNGSLTPQDVSYGSHKKVWWICSKGHEWISEIKHRTSGSGCPYCSGRFPKKGINDLATVNPKLASEWHPTKNGDLTPEQISFASNRKVWWRCALGHEWQAVVHGRSYGRGCPVCGGKQAETGSNDLQTLHPNLATQWHPVRNGELKPEKVGQWSTKNVWWQCSKGHEWNARIASRVLGSGCPYCSGRRALQGINDLATLNPQLASEWHPTKNGELTASQVTLQSSKKVWWICSKGHEWYAMVSSRSALGSGCAVCNGKQVQSGINDLAHLRPNIAAQWHPTRNGELTPQNVTQYSNKKVWWICSQGHEWESRIDARSRGYDCPVCALLRRRRKKSEASKLQKIK